MVRQKITLVFLIAFTVSCAKANQTGIFPSVTSTLPATTVSSLTLSHTPADEPILVFYVSEQGQFEAWMPVSESIIEYTLAQTLFGKSIECPITVSRLNGATAMVQYCDLDSEDIDSRSSDLILEEVRDHLTKDMHLKIDQEQIGVFESTFPTLTLSGEEDMRGLGYDGTFKARIILVENRAYFIQMSVHADNWCNCLHLVDKVVDSLYINPTLSIPFKPTP